MRDPPRRSAFERALEVGPGEPRPALDLGTGPGARALAIVARFAAAEFARVDLAPSMLAEARRKTPPEQRGRVRFEEADAARLPFDGESFELATLANMIPFFDELARVVAPGGHALFSFSSGADTPIYVAPERLRDELERRGFVDFADFRAGKGTALLARKGDSG